MHHSTRWFLRIGYAESGPFTTEAIREALRAGTLGGDMPVRRDGDAIWQNLRDHPAFAAEDEDWVARSGILTAAELSGPPHWTQNAVREGAGGLTLSFSVGSPVYATATLAIYREGVTRSLVSGHETFEVLTRFLASVTAMEEVVGPGRLYRSAILQRLDRVSLGEMPGVPWGQRALLAMESANAPEGNSYFQWLVLSAARNHFVKVIMSVATEQHAWTAAFSFLEWLGDILFPAHIIDGESTRRLSDAESRELSLAKAISTDVLNRGMGKELYLQALLDRVEALASERGSDPEPMRDLAIELTRLSRFLVLQDRETDATAACSCAIGLFRQLLRSGSDAVLALTDLHTALTHMRGLAGAHGAPPETVPAIQSELAQIERALTQSRRFS